MLLTADKSQSHGAFQRTHLNSFGQNSPEDFERKIQQQCKPSQGQRGDIGGISRGGSGLWRFDLHVGVGRRKV